MDQEGERDLGTALARLGRNPRWRPPPGGAVHKLQLAEARKLLPVLTLAGGLARQDTLGEAPRGTNQHFSGQRPRPTRPDLFPGHWCWLPCSPTLTESYEGLSPLLVKLVLSKPTPTVPTAGLCPCWSLCLHSVSSLCAPNSYSGFRAQLRCRLLRQVSVSPVTEFPLFIHSSWRPLDQAVSTLPPHLV